MLTAVGSAEGEASLGTTPLSNDTVVVVECLFHGNEDADVGLGLVGFGCVVPCFGVVVAWCLLVVGSSTASATYLGQETRVRGSIVPTTNVSLGNSS
jgi:hypothetical protein